MSLLSIDVGTTGVTVLVVAEDTRVLSRGYREFPQHFPQAGWVEHDPGEIWAATLTAAAEALERAGDAAATLTAVGITNQRETVCFWDRETLGSARKAIVWQDRRTAGLCDQLRSDGHEPTVHEVTGLRLDPYFSASKIAWVHANDPTTWAGITSGRVAIGTVDSYLVARLTRGLHHVTDASNASRTLLYDIRAGRWSERMAEIFDVPIAALPEVVPSYGTVGRTDPQAFLGLDLAVAGMAGDQQAAMVGQAAFSRGDAKCTYGTGSFLLVNTGSEPTLSPSGLLTTVAWQHPDGRLDYALEGSVFVTGAAIQWLRDGLQIIDSAPETEALARSVPDSGGVMFVPALTGLGAPYWDPQARGTILGITRGTTRAHLVRATLEAIAYQVRDVAEVMAAEGGVDLPRLAVDGGAATNDFLCQIQADQVQVPVERPVELQATGIGAAFLAGLGTGVWSSTEELARTRRVDAVFEPHARDEAGHRRWRVAVERSRGWAALD